MELTGQQILSLPVEQVWDALNDPAILQKCIPGCDTFEATGENQYRIVMAATVGPITAKFKGKLVLSDIQPPQSYKLKFDGSGGAAGSGKGTADVNLSTSPEGTVLQYTVSATVSGRLAQVGARLIDGVAKKMADQFFTRFRKAIEPEETTETLQRSGVESAEQIQKAKRDKRLRWAAAAIIAAIALGFYVFSG